MYVYKKKQKPSKPDESAKEIHFANTGDRRQVIAGNFAYFLSLAPSFWLIDDTICEVAMSCFFAIIFVQVLGTVTSVGLIFFESRTRATIHAWRVNALTYI